MDYLLREVGFLTSGSKLVLLEVWHIMHLSEALQPNLASCVNEAVVKTKYQAGNKWHSRNSRTSSIRPLPGDSSNTPRHPFTLTHNTPWHVDLFPPLVNQQSSKQFFVKLYLSDSRWKENAD